MLRATVPATIVKIGHEIFGLVKNRLWKIADFGHK